jgi:hypothetical protein
VTRAALGRFLRRSAFDIAALGLLALIAFMPVPNAIFLSGFVFAIAVLDRLMMLWRKRCADDDTLDGVKQDVKQTRDLILAMAEDAEAGDDEPGAPDLKLVR